MSFLFLVINSTTTYYSLIQMETITEALETTTSDPSKTCSVELEETKKELEQLRADFSALDRTKKKAEKSLADAKEENEKLNGIVSNLRNELNFTGKKLKGKQKELEDKMQELVAKEKKWSGELDFERDRHKKLEELTRERHANDKEQWFKQLREKENQFQTLKDILKDSKEQRKNDMELREDSFEKRLREQEERMNKSLGKLGSGKDLGAVLSNMVREQKSLQEAKYGLNYERTVNSVPIGGAVKCDWCQLMLK